MDLVGGILGEMSPIEALAAALGLVNVVLVARRSIWNYPFGIAMVALYGWVFYTTRLYSDALLQVFFFVVQFYGWWYWLRGKAEEGEVRVERLAGSQRLLWILGIALATAVWGWLMHRYTNAAFPWWDGSIAMMSVAAQILMSRRFLENWMLWIAVDGAAIPLYAVKGLKITAALYVVFLAISLFGLIEWSRARRRAIA
jgi:nicotinamide mononucleotide transporter